MKTNAGHDQASAPHGRARSAHLSESATQPPVFIGEFLQLGIDIIVRDQHRFSRARATLECAPSTRAFLARRGVRHFRPRLADAVRQSLRRSYFDRFLMTCSIASSSPIRDYVVPKRKTPPDRVL